MRMSKSAWIRGLKDLNELFEKIKVGNSDVEDLHFSLSKEHYSEEVITLWKVLSCPNSKIKDLELGECVTDILVKSQVGSVVRRWCMEVPVENARSLSISFHPFTGYGQGEELMKDLRKALQHPNNRVKALSVEINSTTLHMCDLLVRPVLEHPENEVEELSLSFTRGFDVEAKSLCSGLTASHCHVKSFTVDQLDYNAMSTSVARVLSALNGMRTLERLKWLIEDHLVANQMQHLLTKPGNILRSLYVKMRNWQEREVSVLARALLTEHCCVEELACDFHGNEEKHAPIPLLKILSNLKCRSRSLMINFGNFQITSTVKTCLASLRWQLESLELGQCSVEVAEAIAGALKEGRMVHLRTLDLQWQPAQIFRIFTGSLRSPHNKLTKLRLLDGGEIDEMTRVDFFRALRVSNVIVFNGSGDYSFCEAFNSPFTQVLYTLLSVRNVPRLAQSAWVRTLPVQDLIQRLVETIGWPLNDLCAGDGNFDGEGEEC